MAPSYGIWTQTIPVNWKSVRDVDNEGYHVAMAHPSLQDLYGSTYYDEPFQNGVSRSFATYNPHAGRRWSVKKYVGISPEAKHWPAWLQTEAPRTTRILANMREQYEGMGYEVVTTRWPRREVRVRSREGDHLLMRKP